MNPYKKKSLITGMLFSLVIAVQIFPWGWWWDRPPAFEDIPYQMVMLGKQGILKWSDDHYAEGFVDGKFIGKVYLWHGLRQYKPETIYRVKLYSYNAHRDGEIIFPAFAESESILVDKKDYEQFVKDWCKGDLMKLILAGVFFVVSLTIAGVIFRGRSKS